MSDKAEHKPDPEPVPTPAPYEHPLKAENRRLKARVLRLEKVFVTLVGLVHVNGSGPIPPKERALIEELVEEVDLIAAADAKLAAISHAATGKLAPEILGSGDELVADARRKRLAGGP